MSRKDYILIARAIYRARQRAYDAASSLEEDHSSEIIGMVVQELYKSLKKDNERFDIDTFINKTIFE